MWPVMNSSALIGGRFIFRKKKTSTRFALRCKCCNFNQWDDWIYNRSHNLKPGLYLNLTDDNHLYVCSKLSFFWIGPEFKDRQFLIFFVWKLFLTSALTYTVVSGRSITPSALSKQARIDAGKKLFGAVFNIPTTLRALVPWNFQVES